MNFKKNVKDNLIKIGDSVILKSKQWFINNYDDLDNFYLYFENCFNKEVIITDIIDSVKENIYEINNYETLIYYNDFIKLGFISSMYRDKFRKFKEILLLY
jgi:hypothetical protein